MKVEHHHVGDTFVFEPGRTIVEGTPVFADGIAIPKAINLPMVVGKKTCYSCWDHSFCGALSLVFLGS